MYNAAISFVRRLSGAADNDVDDLHQPEDLSNHHNAETAHDDEEHDEEDENYDEDEEDDDEQMPERRVGLVDYDSDESEDNVDGEHNDGEDEEDMGGPSVDDLFGPGELERRMAEEAAGIDPYAEEFAGIDPYADEFAEARTEVDDDDLAARGADFDEDVPEISEEERAVTEAIYAEIRRKVAEDEAARAAAYDTPYVASPSSSSSSAGSESTSTGSDFMGSCAEPASAAREFRTPPPEDLDEPTTPVLNALPLTREELVVPTADMVASLAGAPRGLILRTMLGHGHRTVIRPSRHGPPTPYTSPRTSPAPDLGIDEADNAPPPAAPRNALKRTMNADYFLADGIGGYFSTRAQHQVSRPWEPSYEDTMRHNERRRAEAAAAAAAAALSVPPQPAPLARSPSVESDDVDMAGIDSAEEDDGDCSPSPGEGTSSQTQQAVEPPVHIATPTASPSTSHRLKRARSEDNTVEDGARSEKRRRVETETQPGSPAAERVRAGMRTRAQAGTSTAAARNTSQILTTMTVAPAALSAGLDVVDNDVDVDNESDEMHVESLILEPVAGPSRQAATAASPAATPKRQPRRRGRAVQKTPTSPRRSTRIRENAARRAKAAEDARAAAAAAPKTIARRGKRSGNGRA